MFSDLVNEYNELSSVPIDLPFTSAFHKCLQFGGTQLVNIVDVGIKGKGNKGIRVSIMLQEVNINTKDTKKVNKG